MSENILKKSAELKIEAEALLKKLRLLEFLKRYGQVFVRGSYELDLMAEGDVDIYVVNNKLNKDLAVDALNKLIKKNQCRGYLFYDFVQRRKSGFPKGYYLGIKTRFKKIKWNMDIWFMPEMDKKSDRLMNFVKNNLTAENKRKILAIKFEIKKNKLDIPSYLVYLGVLKNKAKNLVEIKKYQKDNE